jgi:hypothetical protein
MGNTTLPSRAADPQALHTCSQFARRYQCSSEGRISPTANEAVPFSLAAAIPPCRAYSCITGEPSVSDILSGGSLPASICPCSEPWYCSLVTAGNFSTATPGQPASGAVSGGLAPLPFESLRDAPDSQLKCFRGGLGQATDTYNVSGAAAAF